MTLYGSNGQINTTSVAGSSYTGLYAADGSYNIVTNTSSSYVGLHHACGAYNAFVVTNPSSNFYAANGSINVIANSNSPSGYSPVQPIGVVTGSSDAPQTTDFLARANAVTTLDGTHTAAYKALINGGVTDGWFTKMDMLFIFATQSSGVALLNLANSTYTASQSGTPTFTTDRGFSTATATANILTTFNPTTAVSPNFTRDLAHLSVWNLLNGGSAVTEVNQGPASFANIFPKFTDSNVYVRVNDNSAGFSIGTPTGLILGNRDSSTTRQGYQNGVSIGTYGSVASVALMNQPFRFVGDGTNVSVNNVSGGSVGGSLNATDQLNFYNRMRTYMTSVGVP